MGVNITSGIQIKTHLKSLRNAKGWSQKMLADKMGLSQSRIVQIENNPQLVSIDQLIHLFNILGASLTLNIPIADNIKATQALQPSEKSKNQLVIKGVTSLKVSNRSSKPLSNKTTPEKGSLLKNPSKKSNVNW